MNTITTRDGAEIFHKAPRSPAEAAQATAH
ncbi:hypothetical protein AMOR_32020 [Anaeromyxobacter oryzae]|uniref:Uncharacterized protein n=1 Tax=Anaeromyxobacter oryzae TaxID=2918170 RepID=A0ABM7WXG8_9BACT|nr:hypothetical protein AMOR_32020 [Anaeromyxobacter oryzae]